MSHIRAIHIDSLNKRVRDVVLYEDTDGVMLAKEVAQLCGGHFSAPILLENGDVIYVFDEMNYPLYGFKFIGGTQERYPGSAVVIGLKGSVETDVKSSISEIAARVEFYNDNKHS